MTEEFNLSEKIGLLFPGEFRTLNINYVKEFIRLLKEEFCECELHKEGYKLLGRKCWFCREMDKLAGPKLK